MSSSLQPKVPDKKINRFLIISEVLHKKNSAGQIAAYAPYIREMIIWGKYVNQITILAPYDPTAPEPIDMLLQHPSVKLIHIPFIRFDGVGHALLSLLRLPYIFLMMIGQMARTDHIHLRCPCSIGLIACMAQFFFPKKKKTAKYAGNWDPESGQPIAFQWQQKLLANTFWSKNMQVLVYGEWPGSTRNIVPFFTASYHEWEKETVLIRQPDISDTIQLIFVGSLTPVKQPLVAVMALQKMLQAGYSIQLSMYGDGYLREEIEKYIQENKLTAVITLHGNQSPDTVKAALCKSHFLLMVSRSEGWPKAVAESMFWGCVPVAVPVSCIPQMLGSGSRGRLVKANAEEIKKAIIKSLQQPEEYQKAAHGAMDWARQYTLEYFEQEISRLLQKQH